MILLAAQQLDLDLPGSWVIGDALRDIEAGVAAGCQTILFDPPNVPRSVHSSGETTVLSDHVVSDLKMAMDVIEESISREQAQERER
jgi:phosphoglycolate phosphatase-like HAD superfamily hydrolase